MLAELTTSAVARVLPAGPVTTAALLWRSRGELQLTVIAQARLSMQHERMMLVMAPAPLVVRDAHRDDDPTKSLVGSADLVPFRPRVDVWMTGHAVAAGGTPQCESQVRLALYRGSEPLLDKVVHVHGDRPDGQAVPFERIPLVFERAYGGAGFEANPVGVGADERGLLPNLVNAAHPERGGCFAPISRYWKLRRQYLTSEQRRDLDRPVPELAPDFDYRYFQAAPPDQQVDQLLGDEWLVLDGIDKTLVRLQTRLPMIRALARFVVHGGEIGDGVALAADTLAVDADTKEVRVTWRGVVRVGSADELAGLRLAAGVEHAGVEVDWRQALYGLGDEPTLLDSLSPRALSQLEANSFSSSLDQADEELSRTTIDPAEEIDDRLMRTSIDPLWLTPIDGTELGSTRLGPHEPSYPRARYDDEATQTETAMSVMTPQMRDRADTLPTAVPPGASSWEALEDEKSSHRRGETDLERTAQPPPVMPRLQPPRPRRRGG